MAAGGGTTVMKKVLLTVSGEAALSITRTLKVYGEPPLGVVGVPEIRSRAGLPTTDALSPGGNEPLMM